MLGNNLYILSILFHNVIMKKIALQMLHHMIPNMEYASAYSNWLNLWMNLSEDNRELAVCGKNALQEIQKISKEYLPHIVIAGNTESSEIPFLKDRFSENETLFYVCQNKACLLPTNSINETLQSIKISK